MMSLTNLPKRCVSVGASSQSGSSSDNSVASASDSSTENPFVMLVDAATSLLDKRDSMRAGMNNPMLLDASTSVFDKRDSRMNHQARRESMAPLASTVSPPVTTTAKIPAAVEVKASRSIPPTPPSIVAKRNEKDENKKQTFAELLMSVLDDPAHQEVMCWMPDGKAFTIRNHKKFTMDLMPKLFNIRNMSSFVRKLGRWGFSRVHEKETRNSDIFKHKNFHRGDWELCKTVKCVGRDRIANCKPTPSTPAKTVIDLVGMEYGAQYHHPHHHHSPYSASGSPTILRTTHAIPVRRIPSPPAMVTPPSGDKALLRLEHARRLSAHSRPSAFRSSSSSSKGLGNMTNEVVEAAIETLRRDEETVIVAMPKKYLQSRSGPPPGVRVLSTTSSSGSFGPPTSYPVKTFSRSSFVRHAHNHQSPGRAAPVSLNTRPTNSGAAAATANHSRPMMAQYRERTATNSYAINRTGGYGSSAAPSYQR